MKLRNNLKGTLSYKSFIPTPVGEYHYEVDAEKLAEVESAFKELQALLESMGDDERRELITMEAKDSWRLADDKPANPFAFGSSNNENVDNIVRATEYGEEALGELPLSTRLLRNIHYLICAGSDYDRKYRGEYRLSPVWIGSHGKGLADADFVPPVGDDMTHAIADLENYINYADENCFVKAAVIHYQFEMIHPFVDGNGRTGRLLNNLFLTETGVLSFPGLLISHIILRDYNGYCSQIQRVNETGDMSAWITYWLSILLDSARYTARIVTLT